MNKAKSIQENAKKHHKDVTFKDDSLSFYIVEESYPCDKKSFSVYYDNSRHSIRLLKGDCVEILNKAKENSVDMIFADLPYFLSRLLIEFG